MALPDNWTVDFDILLDEIKDFVRKKDNIADTKFAEPEIISMYDRKIYKTAKKIVELYEKHNNVWGDKIEYMPKEQLIREKLRDMRHELTVLQDIADKDDSVGFGVYLDLQRIIGEIDSLFWYNFREDIKQ